MMDNRLTNKQKIVFNILNELQRETGEYPSFAKIAKVYGSSRQSINDHLKLLMKKGYLVNKDGKYIPTQESREQFMADYNQTARTKLINGK